MDSFRYEETTFLNVDLDLESRSDLHPLVTALQPETFTLYEGRDKRTYRAHLELSRQPKTPDAAIRSFAALISKISTAERNLWNTAKVRDFNIGVQTAEKPHAYVTSLSPETLETVAALNARIVFTIYAPEPSNESMARDRAKSKSIPTNIRSR